jgi:hypothetical protein
MVDTPRELRNAVKEKLARDQVVRKRPAPLA